MKNLLLLALLLSCSFLLKSQIVSTIPAFPTESDSVTITFDAAKGTAGLNNCGCEIYIHTGVITNFSTGNTDWKHVFTTWGQPNAAWRMTALGNNLFSYKIAPSLRTAYNISSGESILKMAMVFRNGDGSKEGKDNGGNDILVNVYTANFFSVSLTAPSKATIKNVNDAVNIIAASSKRAVLTLYENGTQVTTLPNDSIITYNTTATSIGNYEMVVSATYNGITKYDTLTYVVYGGTSIAILPPGIKPGINYIGTTSVTLCLIAPYKNFIYVIGDFTNWNPDTATLMKKTPDGKYFWVTINGLQPNLEYGYQYIIDGALRIADPLSDKILDPVNDKYISASIYPNIKSYPGSKTNGIVSVFELAQTPYNWLHSINFIKPYPANLNIYELLVRDFHQNHNFKAIIDSLEYLKRMGINAIELMPVNEFEGNESWGYNPDFYLAVDKAYGTKNDLKRLLDKCHENGIAVILDIVLNHSFSQSPMVQLYFNSATGQTTSLNPWYNITATHPFSFGNDFNHESSYTKEFVDTVLAYWVKEYHVDGFRFDLSKGFTQKNSAGNVSLWGQYDQSRIDLLQRMYDKVKTYAPSTYMILEHLSDNTEEKELASRGFMLWGNMTDAYNQNTMGYTSNSDLSWGSYKTRSFTNNNLVLYMESHDEERLMYKNLTYGNSSGGYLIKNLKIALNRNAAAAALFFTQPGPKMIWQFGELGYEYSINRCGDGTINSACRTDSKPIKWNYILDTDRYNLYKVYGAIQLLHARPDFRTTNYEWYTSSVVKNAKMNGTTLKVNTICNFDLSQQIATPNFQQTGWWYDYLSGDSINVTNTAMNLNLKGGEYHIYTSPRVPLPAWITPIIPTFNGVSNSSSADFEIKISPNPANGALQITVHGFSESVLSPQSPTAGFQKEFKIRNLLGQTLYLGRLESTETALDISFLEAGVYLFHVGDLVIKFVKK